MDVLRAVRDEKEATVTRMLFLANLSHERLQGYLAELIGRGWLSEHDEGNRRFWTLTEDGRGVLLELERIVRNMEDFGLGL